MVAGGSPLLHIGEETVSFVPNMAKRGSTCNHNYLYRWLPCQYITLLMMGAWRPKHVEKVCSNKICILLHHVGVLFNRMHKCLASSYNKFKDRHLFLKFIFLEYFSKFFGRCEPGSSVGIATELRAGRSGIESRWRQDFPPVQTGPGAHPASCKMGTVSFPGGKVRSGRTADHSPSSSAAVMEQ